MEPFAGSDFEVQNAGIPPLPCSLGITVIWTQFSPKALLAARRGEAGFEKTTEPASMQIAMRTSHPGERTRDREPSRQFCHYEDEAEVTL